jgi:hypothetical protein
MKPMPHLLQKGTIPLQGMKGTMSEMELTLLWQRSHEALQQKARRGELLTTVPVGYVRTTDDRVEKDPDHRIQEVVGLVFQKFRDMGSVRQILVWYRQENLTLPAIAYPRGIRQVAWKLPVYNTLHHMLTNPMYGGAYVFGRTFSQTRLEDGKKRTVRGLPREASQYTPNPEAGDWKSWTLASATFVLGVAVIILRTWWITDKP